MDSQLLVASEYVVEMDYGQFSISNGLDDDEPMQLLDEAMRNPPSASNGRTVVVLSPHQNNFATHFDIEIWSGEAPSDRDLWEQVSQERLSVGSRATIYLDSPTTNGTAASIGTGNYVVEISGRGFVNYGWPGSTQPGDSWRLRFWPDSGQQLRAPSFWMMPGYGSPWIQLSADGTANNHATS